MKFVILAIFLLFNCANQVSKNFTNMNGNWIAIQEDSPQVSAINYSAKKSENITNPTNLRKLGSDYKNVVWLRKQFEYNPANATANIALYIGPLYGKDEIFLNGQLIGLNGKRKELKSDVEYGFGRPRIYVLPPNAFVSGTNVLAIKIDSKVHSISGILSGNIYLGNEHDIQNYYFYNSLESIMFPIITLSIGLFLLLFYLKLNKLKEYLSFSIFVSLFGLYLITETNLLFIVLDNYKYIIKLHFFLIFQLPFAYIVFYHDYFQKKLQKYFYYYAGLNLVLSIATLFLENTLVYNIVNYWIIHLPILGLISIYLIIDKLKSKNIESILYLISICILGIGIIGQWLMHKGKIYIDPSIDKILILYILFISISLNLKFSILQSILIRRSKQIHSLEKERGKIFVSLDSIVSLPIQESIHLIESIQIEKTDETHRNIEKVQTMLIPIKKYVDDTQELSYLRMMTESNIKEPILITSEIRRLLQGKIPYSIKIHLETRLDNDPSLFENLIQRIVQFTKLLEIKNIDLIITQDLNQLIHFRFMLYSKNVQVMQNLYKQLNEEIKVDEKLLLNWQIIQEILRIFHGDYETMLINKKYLRIDFSMKVDHNPNLIVPKTIKETSKSIELPKIKGLKLGKIEIKFDFINLWKEKWKKLNQSSWNKKIDFKSILKKKSKEKSKETEITNVSEITRVDEP